MKLIDCDSHYLPYNVYANVQEEFKKYLPTYKWDQQGNLVSVDMDLDPVTVPGNHWPITSFGNELGLSNIEHRVNDFEKLGISKQLLTSQELAMRFNYSVDPQLATEMCRSFNVEVNKVIAQHPTKFFGSALLPMQSAKGCIDELRWAVNNNFKSVYIDTRFVDSNGCRPITTLKWFGEFLEECQATNTVVYFHPMMHIAPIFGDAYDQIKDFLPSEFHVCIYGLLASGYLDKLPNLQMVFAEGADSFAVGILKFSEIIKSRNPAVVKRPPIEYFKQNFSFVIDSEHKNTVMNLVRELGSERLLFGTDYPHLGDPVGRNMWNDSADFNNLNLTHTDLENIAYKNG